MVHNIYWLTAAELGYFGIFSLMLLLIRIITFSFLNGWRIRRDLRGDLLIGLSISIFIVCLHANYEWIFFMSEIQYIFAIMAGLIVGLTLQIKKGPSAQLSATKHSL
jgi:O-antigen ligase